MLRADVVEHFARIVDEVELVDRENDRPDAQQRDEVRVPACLIDQTLRRIDEDHGELCVRGTGDHVAGVLLVTGSIGDDELAAIGREVPVGDIDGDALFALGGQSIDEEREIELTAGSTEPLRIGLNRGQVVLEDEVRVVQQATDQRALGIVDASTGDEAQQARLLPSIEMLLDQRACGVMHVDHQKYPSCFFFSIDPEASKSMTRPCRSDVVVSSVSWMMPVSVSASLSTAAVSG